jgi:hypothetical protein
VIGWMANLLLVKKYTTNFELEEMGILVKK